jgi:hypothetical protein
MREGESKEEDFLYFPIQNGTTGVRLLLKSLILYDYFTSKSSRSKISVEFAGIPPVACAP